MKHILRLLTALQLIAGTAYAQQPDTYFIYQKNESFDAILMDRVDSIAFSRFDLDSVMHDNVVVQEFWFQGKAQRFLIENIDSIGFYKPETKYKADVFHITAFHLPYAIGVDSLTLTFNNTIPSDRLPVVGQVVISDVRDHPFERGFAGRLREINHTGYGIELVCDRVSIVDIFDRLLAVGHVQATPDDESSNDSNNVRRRAVEEEGTYQLITNKEFSLPLKIMTITDKINYSVDYLVNIGLFRKPIVKVCVNGKHELHGISKLSVKEKEEWDVWPEKLSWNFPIPGLEILTVSLKFGAFAYAGGKMELKGDVPLTLNHSFGFEWKDNKLTPIKSFDYEWGDPEVTLDINGTLRAGIMMKLGINLISDDIASANVTGKIGPQLDAHLVLSSDGVLDQSWYQALKDTKATLSLYTSLDAAFEVFGKDVEDVLGISITEPWEENWLKHTAYLLPKFTTPELVPYAPDYANYSLTSLMTIPSRSTLLPVAVGIGMFDRGGNRIAEKWSGQWWMEPSDPLSKKVQYELISAESHRTHVFRPIVKLLGMTIDAYPEMEFTVPGKITLAADHVMLNEGTARTIEITDGWGLYGNATDQQDVVKESLFGYPDGSHFLYVEGLHAGETTVSVKDIRTGKIVSLQVKVVDPNELLVNPYKVTVTEKETADVTVSGGTGHYKLSSYDSEFIDAEFVSADVIRITALNEGEAIILVEDSQNGYFTNIRVKINPKPKSVALSPKINMTAGDSRLIEIGGYNGKVEIYKEAENFKVVSDAPDIASVRLAPGNEYYVLKVYALKEGIAHITIEDTTTGDKSTMEVNVGPTSSISYTVTDGDYTTYTVNGVPFKMINVEGGTFTMGRTPEQGVDYKDSGYAFFHGGLLGDERIGSDKAVFYENYKRDLPTHQESVANFSIGEMPVTWELYKAVMGEGEGKDDKPIVRRSADFNGFISRLSEITKLPFRRPTEAEWEYAARGGKYSEGYKYPGTNDVLAASFGIPNELGISGLVGGCNEECDEDYLYLDSVERPGTTLRGGTTNVLESYTYGAGWTGWRTKEIIPWTSFRFPYFYSSGWSSNGVSLRLTLGGDIAINKDKWKTLYDHWGSNKEDLDVPLWGEVTIPVYGGYGDFEVTSKDPEIAIGYSHGSEVTVQCVSCGTTTITVTDKKSGASIDFNAYIESRGFSIGTDQKEVNTIPVGIPIDIEVGGGHGRYKFYSEDESAVTISLTPEKQMVMKGTKLGKYKVAVTDLGCRKTIDWEVEVLDTLGLSTDYITIREGDTESVHITHGNGMYDAYCTNSDSGVSIDKSSNGFIYDNIIRITPSEPGTFNIAVYDYQLDRLSSYEDFRKYITVVVPDERQGKKQQLLTELASVKTLAIQTKKELVKKATEEQAYKLYASLFSCNEKILSMEYELEKPHSLTELEKLEADVDALSTEVNQLYVQVNQLQQLRTDEDITEKNLCPDENHPHLIDLGLPSGTKWACCNVGASSPEGVGGYYAWGETAEKSIYSWENYKAPSTENIAGTEYDVAHVQWGESWIMPTTGQWEELVFKTERTRTSRNGMNGDLYTGPNGNSVFMPYGGYKYEDKKIGIGSSSDYWSSTADQDHSLGYTIRPIVATSSIIGIITFADPVVKAICVANWDTDKDGELSYDEAAVVTDLGQVFANNSEITSFDELQYFTGLTEIPENAFLLCDSLTSVIIPNSVTRIGAYAFKSCTEMTSVTIPETVTIIDTQAFYGCFSLKDINIPSACFDVSLETFHGTAWFESQPDGVIYAGNILYTYKGEMPQNTHIDIREGCQSISQGALKGQENLTAITLPTSLWYIGLNGLSQTGIREIIIPASHTTIQMGAFLQCNNLEEVTFLGQTNVIGQGAFSKCPALSKIIRHSSDPDKINARAFYYQLYDMYDESIYERVTLYVPKGAKSAYQTVEPWSLFQNIVEMGGETPGGDIIAYASCPDDHHPHLIDLGLPSGTKWACCNVGASKPEDFGGYYAWGEMKEKSSYDLSSYNSGDINIDIAGTEYDVARVKWGEHWTMPTLEQCKELANYTSELVTVNGIQGCKIVGPNGGAIFLPAAWQRAFEDELRYKEYPYGFYWSSTPSEQYSWGAYALAFQYSSMGVGTDERHLGFSVRPVASTGGSTSDPDNPNNPDDSIVTFVDPNVKSICVANWDTNGDGELSFAEAAAVTDIGVIFKDNKEITSFNELRYFTGLKFIGVDAFNRCANLSSIIIPNNVATIGGYTGYTFYGCNSLTYLYIPKSVSYIGCRFMFYGCNNLTAIDVDAENGYYTSVDGVLFSKDMTQIVNYPPGKSDISYTIPEKVTYIYNDAFAGCNNLTSVNLNNVQIIGEDAFAYCRNLTSVTLSNSVINISSEAFLECTSLQSLSIPASVTNISETAFKWCNSLTDIDVEEGNNNYTSNDGVLYNKNMTILLLCPTGKEVASYPIPDGVIRIGNNAFSNCSGLKTVSIPNSVTEIGEEAFYCSGLTSVTLPEGLKDIEDMVFQGCSGLTTIVIPNSVKSIGFQAFCDCGRLTSVIIGSGMKRVGQSAFINCYNLKNVYCYAEKVPEADMSSFDHPERISLHVQTTSIDDYKAVELWNNFRAILSVDDVASFTAHTAENVEMLFTITSVQEKTCMVGEDGWDTLAIDNATKGVITIPEIVEGFRVTTIGSKAFYNCSGLTAVNIPNSVTEIGEEAFYYCSGLTSVTLPEGLKDIEDMVFSDCSGLTNIVIPNSVESIGYQAFAGCEGLTSLTIGSGVTSIDYSFINCRGLKDVYCYAEKVPEANKWNFNSKFERTLHVPAISIDAYRAVEPWKDFEKIVAIE